jgi:threonine dehydratase
MQKTGAFKIRGALNAVSRVYVNYLCSSKYWKR